MTRFSFLATRAAAGTRREAAAGEPIPGSDFRPTPLQQRFFNLVHEGWCIDGACEQMEISRQTFYLWRQQPDFCAWMAATCLRESVLYGWELLSEARLRTGDSFRYWKAAFDFTFNPATRKMLLEWAEWCAAQDPKGSTGA